MSAVKSIFLVVALFCAGCSWHEPRYVGPPLAPQNWIEACPKGADCVVARWVDEPNPPDEPYHGEWKCPQHYWYAPWVGLSDDYQNPAQVPMVCVKMK